MSMKIKSLKKKVLTFTIAGTILFSPMIAKAELGDQILTKGMTHNDVKVLQEYLKDLNFLKVNEFTTSYDEVTENAVKEFQKANDLTTDGAFGKDTFKKLEIVLNENLGNKLSLSYKNLLKEGSKTEEVKLLQEALIALDFLKLDKTNTTYCSKVKQAVSSFQSTYNLDIDGIAGRDTFNTLSKVLKGEIKKATKKVANASAAVNTKGEQIVSEAKSHLGTPYKFGAAGPSRFDCSGFTSYVYKKNGISIPRDTTGQASFGTKVSKSDLKVGDLVIFSNTYRKGPSHAGIYIGNDKFVHASSGKANGVTTSSLNDGYYSSRFSYGRRVN